MSQTYVKIDNPSEAGSPIIEYATRSGGTTVVQATDSITNSIVTLPSKTGTVALLDDVANAASISNAILSAGCIVQPNYTNNGDGTFRVADGKYNLYSTTNATGKLVTYTIPSTLVSLTDGVDNFVVADYNGGTPIIRSTTDRTVINETTVVPIYTVYRDGITLYVQGWDGLGSGLSNKMHKRLVDADRFKRVSGLDLNEASGRLVTVSAGTVYSGAVPIDLPVYSSLSSNLYLFESVNGMWTKTSVSAYNNTQYNGTTGFKALSATGYAVNFVFRSASDGPDACYLVLGTQEYNLTDAQFASVPSNLPDLITRHCVQVGRIIVGNGATQASQIDSAFATAYSPRVVRPGQQQITSVLVTNTGPATSYTTAGCATLRGGLAVGENIIARTSVQSESIKLYAGAVSSGTIIASQSASDYTLKLPARTGTLATLEDIASAGAGTVLSVNANSTTPGITISGGPITSVGTFSIGLGGDLAAVEGLSSNGYVMRNGDSSWATRTNAQVLSDIGAQPAGSYALTTDARFTDARTPTAHQATHLPGGTDAFPWTTIHGYGDSVSKPAPSASNTGYLFFDTTLGVLQRSNGMAWQDLTSVDTRQVGEIVTGALGAFSNKYKLCDGSFISKDLYPDYYALPDTELAFGNFARYSQAAFSGNATTSIRSDVFMLETWAAARANGAIRVLPYNSTSPLAKTIYSLVNSTGSYTSITSAYFTTSGDKLYAILPGGGPTNGSGYGLYSIDNTGTVEVVGRFTGNGFNLDPGGFGFGVATVNNDVIVVIGGSAVGIFRKSNNWTGVSASTLPGSPSGQLYVRFMSSTTSAAHFALNSGGGVTTIFRTADGVTFTSSAITSTTLPNNTNNQVDYVNNTGVVFTLNKSYILLGATPSIGTATGLTSAASVFNRILGTSYLMARGTSSSEAVVTADGITWTPVTITGSLPTDSSSYIYRTSEGLFLCGYIAAPKSAIPLTFTPPSGGNALLTVGTNAPDKFSDGGITFAFQRLGNAVSFCTKTMIYYSDDATTWNSAPATIDSTYRAGVYIGTYSGTPIFSAIALADTTVKYTGTIYKYNTVSKTYSQGAISSTAGPLDAVVPIGLYGKYYLYYPTTTTVTVADVTLSGYNASTISSGFATVEGPSTFLIDSLGTLWFRNGTSAGPVNALTTGFIGAQPVGTVTAYGTPTTSSSISLPIQGGPTTGYVDLARGTYTPYPVVLATAAAPYAYANRVYLASNVSGELVTWAVGQKQTIRTPLTGVYSAGGSPVSQVTIYKSTEKVIWADCIGSVIGAYVPNTFAVSYVKVAK